MFEGVEDVVLEKFLVGDSHLDRHGCWTMLTVPVSKVIMVS